MITLNISVAQRRFLIPAILLSTLSFLYYFIQPIPTSSLKQIAANIGDRVPSFSESPEKERAKHGAHANEDAAPPPPPNVPADSSPSDGDLGIHLHVESVPETLPDAGIPNCLYPILIHVTPDEHCTGALALYGSIVRNVLLQPEALKGKTCIHLTYVDPALTSISEMYKWPNKPNPYLSVPDCKLLDSLPTYNNLVPVRWQALAPIEKPSLMQDARPNWLAALNKVHSWSFDLYPRILLLDADSILLRDLSSIFDDSDPYLTIAGGVDQFPTCHSRSRLNGGMILLRPSRYFHIVATELLYDPHASCLTGKWQQSEQELLNCICGFNYEDIPRTWPLRSEFRCEIMPVWNSVWPRNYACSDVNSRDIKSIHFTASPKPWRVKEELLGERFDTRFWACVRDAARKGDVEALSACTVPGRDEIRKVKMGGHFVIGGGG